MSVPFIKQPLRWPLHGCVRREAIFRYVLSGLAKADRSHALGLHQQFRVRLSRPFSSARGAAGPIPDVQNPGAGSVLEMACPK